jgi:hypothetical protein
VSQGATSETFVYVSKQNELSCADLGIKRHTHPITERRNSMNDVPIEMMFEANLPNLSRPVRIRSFYEAQVFVRRWTIRDKDPLIRVLLRKLERAGSAVSANNAIRELKRELAARGLLPATPSPLH